MKLIKLISIFSFLMFLKTSSQATLTVNAGNNQTLILSGASTSTSLSGFATTTTSNSITLDWIQISPSTPIAVITGTTTINPSVTFISSQTYVFRLQASDSVSTTTATVSVNVLVNQPPVVNAGPDLSVTTDSFILQGFISDDGNLQPWTTSWSLISGPLSGSVSIVSTQTFPTQSLTVSVFVSTSGTFVFALSSFDGQYTSIDTVTVTVNLDPANTPPSNVNAGVDQNTTNQTFTLSGSATDDGNVSPLTYTWSLVSGPGPASIVSPNSPQTSVLVSQIGSYVFQFSVYDGQYTSTDTVSVVVSAPVVSTLSKDNVILRGSKNVVENGQPAIIKFRVSNSGSTTLTIYGAGGRMITRLLDHEYLTAGTDYEKTWDASGVGSGTYKVRIEQDDRVIKDFYIVVNQ